MHTTEMLLDLGLGGNTWARRVTQEALAASSGPTEGHLRALEALDIVSCGDFAQLAIRAAREGIGYEGLRALLGEAQGRAYEPRQLEWDIHVEGMVWWTCTGTTRITIREDGSALVERLYTCGTRRLERSAKWEIDADGHVVATGWSVLGRPELLELLGPLEPTEAEVFECKLDAAADALASSRRREAAYWGPGPRNRRGHRRGRKPRCPWRD